MNCPILQSKIKDKQVLVWAFSSSSFIESEAEKNTHTWYDLSEMYWVRSMYKEKAFNYLYRQAKAQLSEGGLADDLLLAVNKYGAVPQEVYEGIKYNNQYNHKNLDEKIRIYLDSVIKNPKKYKAELALKKVDSILTEAIGPEIKEFNYKGKKYTPKQFAQALQLKTDDYISITSFQFEPFYSSFILPIADNYHNWSYYNLPLDEMMRLIIQSLEKKQSVILDVDVSEPTFSKTYGLAIMPDEATKSSPDYADNLFKVLYHEPMITQEEREKYFLNFSTTDDHLMHIVGLVRDQIGNRYFKVKNSWGTNPTNDGYVYMSEQYIRAKTISITLKKELVKLKK